VIRYGLRRLLQAVPILFVISLLTFAMLRLIPGDPAILIAGEEATPQALAAIRERLGLDRPLSEQYGRYLAALFRGDLGTSIRTKGSVADELVARVPATLELAVAGGLLFTVVGAGMGVGAATWPGRWPDHLVHGLSLIAVSTPAFWLGALLVWLFAVQWGLLPVAGRGSLAFLILPAVTVSLDGIALLARLVRASLLDVLGEDYIRTAWAKGLPDRAVVGRHALRAALIPVVTVVGLEFGRLLGGVVVVENVFGWPGLGRLLIDGIHARDYPLVQSGILLFAATLIAVNVVVDVLVGVLDPRVRYP
jgi:peptide/nickel transport system permease protein/oligopeptide transport system permease protein